MRIPSSPSSPRATSITPDNKSHAVTIATWCTLATLVIVFLVRQGIKIRVVRKVEIDDLFILLATIFAIGLSITSLVLASDGLGVFGDLTVRRANALMKAYYASNFLYIVTIGLAKLSLVSFFYSNRKQRRYVIGFGIFIVIWTLASVIAVAFQCGLPRPWEVLTLHCYSSGVFWIVYCIIDMTTDVSIIMLSVNLVIYMKIGVSRKIAVVACFASRVLVMGASLARLVYLYPITPHGNPVFELWIPAVCTQVHICLAIVTACIPFMRPFFASTDSGIWRDEKSKGKRIGLDDQSSYGCCSYTHLKSHKRGQDSSIESTAFTNSKSGKTPDVSPRLPTPRPLTPLTPPPLRTPSSSTAGSFRSPSDRGLRLQIPPPKIRVRPASRVDTTSPQTASSTALSPECLSPQPLISPPHAFSPTSPQSREPSPSPPSHIPHHNASNSQRRSDPNMNLGSSPPRFSLFPQPRAPGYSRLPQQYANPTLSIISERSRSGTRTPAQRMSLSGTPETRTPSPIPPLPVSPPSQSNPRFSRVLHDDPLRTKGAAITTSTPVPAPIITTAPAAPPAPPPYESHSSIPSYYITTPPTAHTSDPSSFQTIPSYYMHTPPISQAPTVPLPTPRAPHRSDPDPGPAPNQSTSPQRQRNRRVLSPQNSSRAHGMSPVSPVSPPTPMSFWREGDERADAAAQRRQWQEARIVDVARVRDARSSPRIVIQRFP